ATFHTDSTDNVARRTAKDSAGSYGAGIIRKLCRSQPVTRAEGQVLIDPKVGNPSVDRGERGVMRRMPLPQQNRPVSTAGLIAPRHRVNRAAACASPRPDESRASSTIANGGATARSR